MIRSDWSEGKWIKTGRGRVEKSDQGGYDRGGSIRVEQIKNIRAEREKYSGSVSLEQSEWSRSE